MSPRQQKIEKVFQAALTMDEPERTVFLSETCAGDAEMREEVEKLLTGELPENTLAGETAAAAAAEDRELNAMIGRQIGVYRLVREIGRGGMGAVYLAERSDGAFDQKVAVKLIKRGMDTDLVVRRFRNERQILATLNHPNITRLLDGGSTAKGLPYFVMEYVQGEQLYVYCDKRRLSINERLRIFQKICAAIEEAHRHKIIHRDLKPSNILVRADGEPKLLDFGIAKLLDPDFGATVMEPTATHLRMMTPQYASPEQISGETVTTASDIYSLGVLLYELLTGHRPYRVKSRAPYEIARAVREEEPTRPSESLTLEDNLARSDTEKNEKPTLDRIFASRGAPLEILRRELSGNLDRIVLKTLRKNAAERYRSAAELSEDIANYLEKRPVKAQDFDLTENAAPSAAVTADGEASADAAAAKNSIAILPFKLIRPAERGAAGGDETTGDEYLSIGLADALGSRLSGVKRLVVRPTSSILRYANEADPFAAGRELNVEFIVGGSIRRTGDRVRVSVRLLSIGENAARWAEDFDEKMTDVLEIEDLISERVVRILVSHLTGEEKNQLAKRSTSNAEAYEAYLRGRYHWNQFTFEGFAKALAFYRRAIELAPDYALAYAGIADYYNFLGVYAVRPFAETTAATKKAAQQAIALDPTLAEAYAALGFASQMGDFDWEAAENHLLRSIELNPNYSTGRVWYSYHLGMTGRFEEAFAQVNKALEIDPFTPLVPQTYNWMLYHARRYDEAIAETYRLIEKEPQYGLSYVFLSGMLWHTGKYAEAVKVAHKMVEIMGRTGYTLCWLGSAYAAAGQLEEARAVIGELENLSATQYVSPYLLAMIYVNLRDREKTFELLEKAVEIRDGRLSYLAADPQFDLFRSDPRYNKILKAINHPSVTRPPESGSGGGSKTIGRENSIAVLPLKILGTRNPDDEYLGIGLTDSLITRLSNVRRFVMRPTSSVLQYANSPTDPFEAGRKLSVEYVLDGNLRRAGERIRVTVQLLSVRENAAVWAESFDEKSSDVLELEDSISEKVAQSLIPQLTGEERRQLEKRGTNNPEAYEEYLRGRYFWNQFTNESLPKALASFQKAVALDPEYAAAYVGLADFYNWAGIFGILPSMDCYREAKRAALRALEIDDQLSEANAAFAFITAFGDWKWADGENFIKRAIQLNPSNALAHEWYSTMLMATGRIEQGLAEIRRAEKLDPFSLRAKTLTTWTFYQGRLYEEAAAKAQELIEMDPNYWQGYVQLGNTYIQTGRAREATKLLQHALKLAPGSGITLYKLCFALVAENRVSEAREILRQLADGGAVAGYSKPYFVAMGHVALGESDAAFEWFEKAVQVRDGWLVWLLTETKLDPLRPDARFINLLRRLNFPTGGIDYGGSRGQRS